MTTLGTRLRTLRQQAGLSQAALAAGLVSKSMISQIEADKARPSRELLAALAERLSAPLDQLLPVRSEAQERLARYKQAQAFLALAHDEEALPLLLDCVQHPQPGWPLLELVRQTADCLHRLQRYEEARLQYEMALRLAIRESRMVDAIGIRFALGQVAYAGGHVHVALHEWLRAYQDLRTMGAEDLQEMLEDTCLQLAMAYEAHGRREEAVRFYLEAHRLLQKRPRATARKRAAAVQGVGTMFAKLQRYGEAEEYLQEAGRLYEQMRDGRRLYEVRAQQVGLLREAGRQQEAQQLLDACLRELDRRVLPQQRALLLHEQALLDRQSGQLLQAIERLQQAIELATGNSRFLGCTRLLVAELCFELGEWQAAAQEAEQAKDLLAVAGRDEELVRAYELLIRLYKQSGDYEKASEGVAARNELLDRQLRRQGWVL